MNPVDVVVPYDADWPTLFDTLRSLIDPTLDGVDHATEHVGSTAVPGLAAKPIIDIDIVVPTLHLLAAAITALTNAGYQHQGDLGIPGRQAFRVPINWPYHHLYLVVAGNEPYRDHVDLRDYLRTHPEEARRYGQRKRELAVHLANDRSRYFEGKHELIEQMLERARRPE